ncbi:hypothetical protein [Kocuria sp.]|uniref:hypothetical protein n=1 Tax=Kocuria sp. TaxID=1871328 RepID=UPI0026DECCCA|nr:hypothetical protein [Kocuria sp.]MDO5618176.1 hypothetical protein [Kocuria sp.]
MSQFPVPQSPRGSSDGQFNSKKLSTWLLISAGAYLVMNLLHVIARTTETYQTNVTSAVNELMGESGVTMTPEPAVGVTNLLMWAVVLGLYALINAFLRQGKNWARVTGIVLACLGSAAALFGMFNILFYGAFGIVVALGVVAFIAVNVVWIVAAVRGR